MWLNNYLDTLMPRSGRTKTLRARTAERRRHHARRLLLESLEQRRLLAFDVLAEQVIASSSYMELARIDADDRLDLVLIENSRITIRPGNADGSFGDPLLSVGDISAHFAITGDFTDDGIADLVTSYFSQLRLQIGNGDGTFQEAQSVDIPPQRESAITGIGIYGQYINSLATGDLDADGKLDLVVGGTTSFPTDIGCGYYSCGYIYSYNGYVNVLLGTGAGSFDFVDADQSDPDLHAYPLGPYQSASSLAIEDVNNDGQPDVIASKFYGAMATLLGNGDGTLQPPIHSGSGSGFSVLPLGDVDGDGNLDTVSRSGNNLIVQKGLGNGSFVQAAVADVGQKLDSAVMGDVNGDGKLDLVAVGAASCTEYGYYGGCYDSTRTRQASVLLGNGQGGFSLPISSSLGMVTSTYINLNNIALTDLTGDGRLDVVTVDSGEQGAVIVAENDGQWVAPAEFAITDVSVVEGDSGSVNAVFTVTLTGSSGGQATVDFVVFDYYDYGDSTSAQAGVDYTAESGTLTFGPGVLTQTITVAVLGDRIGEINETFHVGLSKPTGALLRDAEGVGTIVDDEPAISIDHPYEIDPLTVVEGDGGTTPAVFTVTLSQPYDEEVTVDYYTLTGHTNDIIDAQGTLRFAPGETSQQITIYVINDLLDEALEAFNVYLTNPSSNATIAQYAGYCYIEDNDPTPTVSIRDVSKTEGSGGTTRFNFKLTLSAPSNGVSVEFVTANGTASTDDQDFVAKSGYVYFAVGQTTTMISIEVKGDTTIEANETFFVNLIGVGGATIIDDQGTGTILNDDPGKPTPTISISDAVVSERNSGTELMTFIVSLSQPSTDAVRVKYATANGTATVGSDYQIASGTLTIPAGQTTGTITVLINGDRIAESDEVLVINLSRPANASIDDGQGTGTIVDDEPRVRVGNVTKSEGTKGGTTLFTFTVTLSAAYDQPVTMSFQTADGTATASKRNRDYVATTGTLTFAPGETTKTITIEVKGDRKREDVETFYLDLSDLSSNAQFSKRIGIGRILNDD